MQNRGCLSGFNGTFLKKKSKSEKILQILSYYYIWSKVIVTFWCFGTCLAKQKFKIVQIGEIVNLSKTKALNWDMRDFRIVICENIEKHTLNWHVQLWLYLFEEPFLTLFSVSSLIFPQGSISDQYQSTSQAHCIYFSLKIKCSFSLVTHLELRKL